MIVPEPEDHRPAIALRREVLPAPLGPTISRDSPGRTCRNRHHSELISAASLTSLHCPLFALPWRLMCS